MSASTAVALAQGANELLGREECIYKVTPAIRANIEKGLTTPDTEHHKRMAYIQIAITLIDICDVIMSRGVNTVERDLMSNAKTMCKLALELWPISCYQTTNISVSELSDLATQLKMSSELDLHWKMPHRALTADTAIAAHIISQLVVQ